MRIQRAPRGRRAGLARAASAALASIAAGALVITACAPSSSPSEGGNETTGTLRVWLFDEPNRAPKEKLVDAAVAELEAAHEDVTVEVEYIAVETRNERFTGAFNDPASAPDMVEYGNTDLPAYVEARGLADLSEEVAGWEESGDIAPALMESVTVDGKVYGVPWYIGVRALYYRTDIFSALGLDPPASQPEIAEAARQIRAANPDMLGIAVGGLYVFGMLPFVWDAGGDIATAAGDSYTAAIDSTASRAGVNAYAELFADDICPAQQCAQMSGGKTVDAFASGKAGMAILGNFNRGAVDSGAVKGNYDVVPLPGSEPGSIAPAFAGGNNLGVMNSSQHRTLAFELLTILASKEYQAGFYEAMGNLPTFGGVLTELAAEDPFLEPFDKTLSAGTRFVPLHAGWGKIDAQQVLPNMMQKIVSGQASVDDATSEAAGEIDAAFAE